MRTKRLNQLLAAALSIVMVLSLFVVPASAAVSMGGSAVAETPAEAPAVAGPVVHRPAALAADGDLTGAVGDKWDFSDSGFQAQDTNTALTAWKGLTIANAYVHSSKYIRLSANGKVTVPVAGKCNVEVITQFSGGTGTIGVTGADETKALNCVNDSADTKTVFCYDAETAGTVEIANTDSEKALYLTTIEIKTYDDSLKGEVGDKWDFSASDFQGQGNGTAVTSWKGLTISNGKVHSGAYLNLGAPATVSIPVAGKCDVAVSTQYGVSGLIGVGDNTITLDGDSSGTVHTTTWHYDSETAGTVTVSTPSSNSDAVYLTTIEIKEYTDPAPAISLDKETATVTMANGDDAAVTATATITYANITADDMATVTAAAEDTDVVTAEVSADKGTLTLTPGTKAGTTKVTVTATPTDTGVEPLTAEIEVTNVDPSAAPIVVAAGAHKWADTVVNEDDAANKYKPNDVGVTFTGEWKFDNSHGPKSAAATDTITLSLAEDSNVVFELCQYSNSNNPTEASVVLTGGAEAEIVLAEDGELFRSGEKGKSATAAIMNVPAGEAVFTFSSGVYVHGVTVTPVVAEGTYKWVDRPEADRVQPTDAGISFAPDGGKWGYGNQHGPNTANADPEEGKPYTLTLALAGPANVAIEMCGYSKDGTEAKFHVTLGDIEPVESDPTMKSNDGGKTLTFMNVPAGDAVFNISKNTYVHGVTVTYVVPEGLHTYAKVGKNVVPEVSGVTFNGNWDGNSSDHGNKTGADGLTLTLALGGDAKVSIYTCGYSSATEVSLDGTAPTPVDMDLGEGDQADKPGKVWTFKKVPGGVAEFTISKSNTYIHRIEVEYLTEEVPVELGNGKVDVWDFGAEILDETRFNNMLTPEILAASVWGKTAAGEFGDNDGLNGLTFYAGGSTNHRIYTTNEALTTAMKFTDAEGKEKNGVYGAEGMSDVKGEDPYFKDVEGYNAETAYKGYVYSNGNAAGRDMEAGMVVYLSLDLNAGDKVTIAVSSNGGNSTINFAGPSGIEATALYETNSRKQGEIKTFYAREDGNYKIYSSDEKLVVARLYREHPTQLTVSGTVTLPEGQTELPAGIAMAFTNNKSGAVKETPIKAGDEPGTYVYSTVLVAPYDYKVATKDGKGFIVETGRELDLQVPEEGIEATHDVVLTKVPLVAVSGTLTGPDAAYVTAHKPVITLTPGPDYIYVPEVALDGLNYSFEAEQGVEYTVDVKMVNDFSGPATTKVTYTADKADDTIVMTAKPVYNITVTAKPSSVDLSNAKITFVNLYEAGKGDETKTIAPYDAEQAGKGAYPYTYTYTGTTGIQLRDGQYEVLVAGVGAPEQGVTANLKVNGKAASIEVPFDTEIPYSWNFGDADFDATDLPAAKNGDGNYKGLLLEGNIQKNKTYCLMGNAGQDPSVLPAATVKIPVKAAGNVVTIEYCYSGTGTLGNVDFAANECSGSTSKFETVTYTATAADATAGYVTLTIAEEKGETDANGPQIYLTKIDVTSEAYQATLKVGKDKPYKTIAEALDVVAKMAREPDQRVTIEIDPGTYEEHLIIYPNNVTLKNAKAADAKLELKNKGVDIGENEVRITHYYGTGYDYYSMTPGTFQWSADTLAASEANGYPATSNKGDGKYNGYGYWCASVLVKGSGFEAEGIIFENSFNQYISKKSTEDTLVPNGKLKEDKTNPRAAMKTVGDTTVQNKAYVERAAAVALTDTADKAYFNHCAIVGRQDALYGDPIRAAFYNCDLYGGTDYIFGGMTAVFAQCNLILNTMETNTDVAYIVAPQQDEGVRGYLMWNCTVKSTEPGVNTNAKLESKPGQLGRPWSTTSEAVFYATNVEATFTTVKGEGDATRGTTPVSLIDPAGWLGGLSAGSSRCVEYDTIEAFTGIDNSAGRNTGVSGGVLASAVTADGKDITDYKTWMDGWNPLPDGLTVKRQEQKTMDDVLTEAIEKATAAAEAATVSADGKDVEPTDEWVTEAALKALTDAIAAAQAVADKADATDEEKVQARNTLLDALRAFEEAKKAGTKTSGGTTPTKPGNSGGSGVSSGTGVTITTVTNPDGSVATTKKYPNGNVEITVVSPEGETLAEIALPGSVASLSTKFIDVPDDHWAAACINDMAARGLVKGVNEDGTIFDMTSPITRGSIATILYRLSNGAAGKTSTFADVPAGSWYADAIGWAANAKLINGYDETSFGPDDTITRQQLAVMIARMARLIGIDTSASASALDGFTDGADTADWAAAGMAWCVKAGIVKGKGGNVLDPTAAVTRAEAVTMIDRMLGLVK